MLQVRTLFVSGLPMDTKPRELYLLFRAYEVSKDYDNDDNDGEGGREGARCMRIKPLGGLQI